MNICCNEHRKSTTIREGSRGPRVQCAVASNTLAGKQVRDHMDWIDLNSGTVIDERKNFVSHDR